MVRYFEEADAGAAHIEYQMLPKKCGHLNDKKLADAQCSKTRSRPSV